MNRRNFKAAVENYVKVLYNNESKIFQKHNEFIYLYRNELLNNNNFKSREENSVKNNNFNRVLIDIKNYYNKYVPKYFNIFETIDRSSITTIISIECPTLIVDNSNNEHQKAINNRIIFLSKRLRKTLKVDEKNVCNKCSKKEKCHFFEKIYDPRLHNYENGNYFNYEFSRNNKDLIERNIKINYSPSIILSDITEYLFLIYFQENDIIDIDYLNNNNDEKNFNSNVGTDFIENNNKNDINKDKVNNIQFKLIHKVNHLNGKNSKDDNSSSIKFTELKVENKKSFFKNCFEIIRFISFINKDVTENNCNNIKKTFNKNILIKQEEKETKDLISINNKGIDSKIKESEKLKKINKAPKVPILNKELNSTTTYVNNKAARRISILGKKTENESHKFGKVISLKNQVKKNFNNEKELLEISEKSSYSLVKLPGMEINNTVKYLNNYDSNTKTIVLEDLKNVVNSKKVNITELLHRKTKRPKDNNSSLKSVNLSSNSNTKKIEELLHDDKMFTKKLL